MLVYEKGTGENRHLYGTMSNIPADTDNQLVYKDADGEVLTDLTLSDSYVDDGDGGILVKGTDTFVGVYIKKQDNSLFNIIPGEHEVTLNVTNIEGYITINDSFTPDVACTLASRMLGNDTVPGEDDYQFHVSDFIGAPSDVAFWSFDNIIAAVYGENGEKLYDVPSSGFVFSDTDEDFNISDGENLIPVTKTQTLVISGIGLELYIDGTTNILRYIDDGSEDVYWSPSDVTNLDSAIITYAAKGLI